jgi:hypothetical protein
MSEDDFKEDFPALSEEMETGGTQKHRVDGVRAMSEEESKPAAVHFTPSVVDYIRRCDTDEQAVEIVEYLLNRGELSQKEARAIKVQLKSEGIRSFGAKKERDHYLHHGLESD